MLTVKEINHCALHGTRLPEPVNAPQQILYRELSMLYQAYAKGLLPDGEVRRLRSQYIALCQDNEALFASEMQVHKTEQERIRVSENLLAALNRCTGTDGEKLKLAEAVIKSMRGRFCT